MSLGNLVPVDLGELLRTRVLRVRRPVWGRGHGRHASRRVGLGLDFRDHRGYVPGDDPRGLDWRAVARRDRLVLRQTEAEDELTLMLALDLGANMAYGTGAQAKIAVAKALAAALAWTAIRQGDRVGLVLAGGGTVEATLQRPASGRDRLDAITRSLTAATPRGRAPLPELVARIAPRLAARSLVVLFSDLLDPATQIDDATAIEGEFLGGLAQLRARGHDVVVLQTLHRDEVEFPWDSDRLLRFVDPRGVRVDIEGAAASLRARYLERLGAHLRGLESACEAHGILRVVVRSDEALSHTFAGLLGRLAGDAPMAEAAR